MSLVHRSPTRDAEPDLDMYLTRVEQLDSLKGYSSSHTDLRYDGLYDDSRTKNHSPDDIRKAQLLLDGVYERNISDLGENRGRLNDLAYKSAYNYERAFSPVRKKGITNYGYSILPQSNVSANVFAMKQKPVRFDSISGEEARREYVVSAEDYQLLQAVKRSLASEVSTGSLVNGGLRSSNTSTETKVGDLLADPVRFDKDVDPQPEATTVRTTSPMPSVQVLLESPKSPPKSQPKEPVKEPVTESTKAPIKTPIKAPATAPARQNTQERSTKHLYTLPKSQPQPSSSLVGGKTPPKVPRKKIQLTYLESLERSRLGSSSTHHDVPRTPIRKTTGYDPITSVLKKNASSVERSVSKTINGTGKKVGKADFMSSVLKREPSVVQNYGRNLRQLPVNHESSIELMASALKTTGTPSRQATIAPPPIPPKPRNLSLAAKEEPDLEDILKQVHLNKVQEPPKVKPLISPKKGELFVPKLRSVKTNKAAPSNKEIDLPELKPVVRQQKRDASTPEALAAISTLKPAPQIIAAPSPTPEALLKLSSLNKTPAAPEPERVIPEALVRATQLQKATPLAKRIDSIPEALKKVQELGISQSTPRTLASSRQESLGHPTKIRPRGPPRRLPSNVAT
ncbi:HDL340Wp [Eremothecium sinecaudum]|uniref:HDL340Wp n=1 Tax=Eremothecium sinecaudum TaxID=45286 RepID=A0A0X8HS21_9SACH|nr:HDL340Wp [Eremothecium sinecaudum]AMD20404.1 HDL340Wp [Eremothecium sinecaudum]